EVAEGQELADELFDAARSVHVEWDLATVHRHALDHPRQAEEMVSVEVGEEDAGHLHEAQAALHELPLRSLATVEQDDLRAALHRDRAHVSLRRGPGSGGPEEHNLHGPVPEGRGALNVFGAGAKTFIAEPGCRGGPPCVRSTDDPSTSRMSSRWPAAGNRCASRRPPRSGWIRVAARWKKSSPKGDRKSTRLNSSHLVISYAVLC